MEFPEPPGPPPIPLPSGHKWVPKKPSTPQGRRGWKPSPPIKTPKGSQQSCCSWDPFGGHYDYYDPGDGSGTRRFDPAGNPVDHWGNPIAPLVPVTIIGTIIGIIESGTWALPILVP